MLTMEYMDGAPLQDVFERLPSDERDALAETLVRFFVMGFHLELETMLIRIRAISW